MVSNKHLPSTEQAVASLRLNGNQFESTPLNTRPLGNVTYTHPRKGRQPVKADKRVLQATGRLYIPHRTLRRIIHTHGGNTCQRPRLSAFGLIFKVYRQPRLIWGVSGFATHGFNCSLQAEAVELCFRHIAKGQSRPALIVDGAACAGVLGLSGVLAKKYGFATFGITPLQGVASMAPRDYMLFHRDTYREREAFIGMLPDILLCIDGGQGTLREALTKLKMGGIVILVASRSSDPNSFANSWQRMSTFTEALRKGRFIVCGNLNTVPAALDHARMVARKGRRRKRLWRFVNLSKQLFSR